MIFNLKVSHSSAVFDAIPRAETLRKRHTKRRVNDDSTLRRVVQTHPKIFDQTFLAKGVRLSTTTDVTGCCDHEAGGRITSSVDCSEKGS